jgi:hypothetical protein
MGAQVVSCALERGLVVRALPADSVAVCPPLVVTVAEVDEIFDRLEAALDDAVPRATRTLRVPQLRGSARLCAAGRSCELWRLASQAKLLDSSGTVRPLSSADMRQMIR